MDGPTQIIPVTPDPPPVFVDPSGRRRRWLRWSAYALGLAGVAYTVLVGVSFVGGPVRPETVVPFVEPTAEPWQPPASVEQVAVPAPTATTPVPSRPTTAPRSIADPAPSPTVAPPSPEPTSIPADPSAAAPLVTNPPAELGPSPEESGPDETAAPAEASTSR